MNNQKRIKVLIGANDLVVGGVQRLIIDQLQNLDSELFDFSLITLFQFPDKGDFYDLVPAGVKVSRMKFTSFWDVRSWLGLVRIMRKIKPDIVKSNLFFSNIVFGLLQPFFGYRLIAAEHNTLIQKTKSQIILNRMLMRVAETMVVDSNMVADSVSQRDRINRKKFTVIYNGVDIKRITEAQRHYGPQKESMRKEWGLGQEDKVFLTVARLSPQKNHALMIDAFAQLARMRDDCRLIIVGDGDRMESIKEQIRTLQLEGKVILPGERKDTDRFYAISDFFLLTSDHEGFCIAAMEGLAYGMPLLSTRVAGVSEYLEEGKNGFFVESDAQDIAQKMNLVASFSEEEIRSFSINATKTAQNYSLERYVRAYRDILSTLARTTLQQRVVVKTP